MPANQTAEEMTLLLETQLSMPGLVVARWGECDNYHWGAQFKHQGGLQPPFTVNGSSVVFNGSVLRGLCD